MPYRSGLEAILPEARPGRPLKLTEEQLKRLLELVASEPRDLDLPFSTWTAELLALALREQAGILVSESTVRRALHREGYSVQRPVLFERFWKHLCRQVTHNHFFQTMERLMDAVVSFFRDMAASPDLVCSVAGLAA